MIELRSQLPQGYREDKDNWLGVTSAAERRKIQNRLNQRIWRRRRANEAKQTKTLVLQQDRVWATEADDGDVASDSSSERSLALAWSGTVTPADARDSIKRSLAGASTYAAKPDHLPTLSTLEPDHLLVLQPLLSSPKLREVWRYGVNVLWPGSDPRPPGHPDSWTWSLFKKSTTSPLLFHSLSWSMSAGVDLYRVQSRAYETVGLAHQTIALRLLKQGLEQSRGPVIADDLTLAIALLMQGRELPQFDAANRTGRLYGAFKPLLQHLQWLSCVGGTEKIEVHKMMLRSAIDAKGGLTKLESRNMAAWLQYHDIADVSHTISTPYFGLSKPYQYTLENDVPRLRRLHQSRSQVPFCFQDLGLSTSFQDLLWDMRTYVELVEQCCAKLSGHVNLAQLATYRNLIQYRLLSTEAKFPLDGRYYEVCRLGALIFSYAVVYPLPDRRPLSQLTQQLKGALYGLESESMPDGLLLWLNMLGAMAVDGRCGMEWFMGNLVCLADKMQLRRWQNVREIMSRYLWSDPACAIGGLAVWRQVADFISERQAGKDGAGF